MAFPMQLFRSMNKFRAMVFLASLLVGTSAFADPPNAPQGRSTGEIASGCLATGVAGIGTVIDGAIISVASGSLDLYLRIKHGSSSEPSITRRVWASLYRDWKDLNGKLCTGNGSDKVSSNHLNPATKSEDVAAEKDSSSTTASTRASAS